MYKKILSSACALTALGAASIATAETVSIRVTVENLAPENSVALAPVRFGFGNGTFDSFDVGQAAFTTPEFPTIAEAPIVTIAEGGSGSSWFPAFEAAEPDANLGSVLGTSGNAGPPFTPGEVGSTVIEVDLSNPYFTFGTMVVPSNDFFLGNDSPTAYRVLDDNGDLLLTSFTQTASDVWDAGSEQEIAENAAFLEVGTNSQRVDENGTVEFNFAELSVFDGLTTAEGYVFDADTLAADTELLRVSFEVVVPEPATAALALPGALGAAFLRRRRS